MIASGNWGLALFLVQEQIFPEPAKPEELTTVIHEPSFRMNRRFMNDCGAFFSSLRSSASFAVSSVLSSALLFILIFFRNSVNI